MTMGWWCAGTLLVVGWRAGWVRMVFVTSGEGANEEELRRRKAKETVIYIFLCWLFWIAHNRHLYRNCPKHS